MFHVMLVLPFLVLGGFFVSILLFGIFALIASVVGGASSALFIKSKTPRRLLFIGSSILSFVALLFIIPFIAIYAQLQPPFFTLAIIITSICIAVLSAVGIRFSTAVVNKIGRTVLFVVFGLVFVLAVAIAIFVPVVRALLLAV